MADSLTEVIDKLVQERTFGLEGLEGVKRIKDHAATLEQKLKDSQEAVTGRDMSIRSYISEIAELRAIIEKHHARDADLTKREAKVRELEMREAVSTARAQTMESVFGTIFKNVTVREQNLRQLPFTYSNNGGPSTSYSAQPETVERTSE
jgi:DNA anti-recombination protein RmuC